MSSDIDETSLLDSVCGKHNSNNNYIVLLGACFNNHLLHLAETNTVSTRFFLVRINERLGDLRLETELSEIKGLNKQKHWTSLKAQEQIREGDWVCRSASALASSGRSSRSLAGKTPVQMAAATADPMAPPTDANMPSTAMTTATYWWEVAAMAAICSQITRVPPEKAMKIWHMMI